MPTQTTNLGAIHAEAIYPLPEFQRLTGLGESAMREARRRGLVITTIGRRRYVRGADFCDHVGRLAGCSKKGGRGR